MANIVNSTQNVVSQLYTSYQWTLTLSDPRSKNWLLVDSPVPIIFCNIIYISMVWMGPKLMQYKKAFQLKSLLIFYNLFMALLNLYIIVQLFTASRRLKYSYQCEPCRQSFHPDELQIVNAVWWYYFSKVLEFSDTLFFILRKRDRQLTFLHVYHHSTMSLFWWIGIKWIPSGATVVPAMINSVVHVVMYLYYGLSALGPQVAKYLWWKKYLTKFQLIQFVCLLSWGSYAFMTDSCGFPKWMIYTLIGYMISFLFLFGNFYRKTYQEEPQNAVHKNEKKIE